MDTHDDWPVPVSRFEPDRTETGIGGSLHLTVLAQTRGDEDGRGVDRVRFEAAPRSARSDGIPLAEKTAKVSPPLAADEALRASTRCCP